MRKLAISAEQNLHRQDIGRLMQNICYETTCIICVGKPAKMI